MSDMNSTAIIPAEVNNWYDRNLLEAAVPLLFHTNFAQVRDIPQNSGTKVIKFRRYELLDAVTTPLVEGVTPVGGVQNPTDITAEVKHYGHYQIVTDEVDVINVDPELLIVGKMLGEQAGRSIDNICRDIIVAGTSVSYGGSGHNLRSQVAAGEIITTTLVDKAIRTLKGNNAKKVMGFVSPDAGYATTPINQCYVGLTHQRVAYDIQAFATNYKSVELYQRNTALMPGEFGAYKEVRFCESTEAKVFSGEGYSSIDVYPTLIFGMDAYGISRISGKAMENIVKPFGAGEDPLNQRATSGWKAWFTAKILNDNFITRIETAVTA
jgi:N4-gp56 family major capsid protein